MITFDEIIASDSNLLLLSFGKIASAMTFIAHWMACFYWAVGTLQAAEFENSWIKNEFGSNLAEDQISKQYVFSLYWAI